MDSEFNVNEKVMSLLQKKTNLRYETFKNDVDIEGLFLDDIIYDENVIFSHLLNYLLVKRIYIDFYSIFTIGYIEGYNLFFVLRDSVDYDDYNNIGTLIYSPSLFNLICHDLSYYEKLMIIESEESELPDFTNLSI